MSDWPLPTEIDLTYPDRSLGDKAHQQDHDLIHTALNSGQSGGLLPMQLIGRQTSNGSGSTVTISGIPATFSELILTGSGLGVSTSGTVSIIFNGVTGTNYDWGTRWWTSTGGTSAASAEANAVGTVARREGGGFVSFETRIAGYATATPTWWHGTYIATDDASPFALTGIAGGRFVPTDVITQIAIQTSDVSAFAAGGVVSLWGRR